jgi:hypothetical protein
VKILFGWVLQSIFQASSYLQVVKTSTDLEQQFSAPFKAGNSRQVQTCYKATVQKTKETATFSSLAGMQEMGVSMTLNHCASEQ